MNILIVDDDKSVRFTFRSVLGSNGFNIIEAPGGKEALEILSVERPDAILLDLRMPEMDGIETLHQIKKIAKNIPVIIVTAYGDIQSAVEAIKLGAYDFIAKPPDFNRLIITLKRAVEKSEMERAIERLSIAVETSLEDLFGKSDVVKKVIKKIHQVAWSDFSIIIQGETGTGKSVAARAIHNLSKRVGKSFVTVDMGAIPETLVESELFGHEKGAFTGADKKKKGYFEMAGGGTIFIDELQNISTSVQGKILRAVEERKIYPLGSATPVDIDVRVMCATNKDVKQAVKENKLREDLFYRIGEFIISLPTLRERTGDIRFLARRFCMEAAGELNKQTREISDEALNLLMRYPWPGNVRELKNVVRRAVLLSTDSVITPDHMEFLIGDKTENAPFPLLPLKEIVGTAVREVEEKTIKRALESCRGRKTRAASMLQIDYKTLLSKIKEYRIE